MFRSIEERRRRAAEAKELREARIAQICRVGPWPASVEQVLRIDDAVRRVRQRTGSIGKDRGADATSAVGSQFLVKVGYDSDSGENFYIDARTWRTAEEREAELEAAAK